MAGAEFVPVDAVVVVSVFWWDGVWFRKAVVKKAFIVVFPSDAGEFAPFDCFVVIGRGVDVTDFNFLPVTAAGGKGIGK